jgi:tRNA G18 (ribose-2'-O)-methylase SpoU
VNEPPPFRHLRHQSPTTLEQARELIVVVPDMQSHVNLSRIVRAAGCCGVRRMVAGGHGKIDPNIARSAKDYVLVEFHRTLLPVLRELRASGRCLVGLEQTTRSVCLYDHRFRRDTVLVIGHERRGMDDELLQLMQCVVEIPIYGEPASHNAATAAAIAMYEYCRQFPAG